MQCSNLKVKRELPVLGKGGAGGPVNDVRKGRQVDSSVKHTGRSPANVYSAGSKRGHLWPQSCFCVGNDNSGERVPPTQLMREGRWRAPGWQR